MKITKLTTKDFTEAARLYQEHYPCAINDIIKYMKLDGVHLVAKENNQIIGVIIAPYSNMNQGVIEISFLAISKEQRGKGVGSKLLNELEKKTNKPIITYSKSAIEFYKKKGFKEIAEIINGKLLIKNTE